jgi:prepilin-type N-terminal cleavage/methylation domain-containing protein
MAVSERFWRVVRRSGGLDMRRQEGFTLIEILVVITIIAALAALVTLLIPEGERAREKLECQNNLRQIGGLLKLKSTGQKMKYYTGAGFLLQIANDVPDEDLEVFICPGEFVPEDTGRPAVGTPEFVEMYRKMDLKAGGVEDALTSYAGPNWKEYPPKKAGRGKTETRLWGCDRCKGDNPHHDGITVLYSSSKVSFLKLDELEGHQPGQETIQVGQTSPDPRLRKMIFYPER